MEGSRLFFFKEKQNKKGEENENKVETRGGKREHNLDNGKIMGKRRKTGEHNSKKRRKKGNEM